MPMECGQLYLHDGLITFVYCYVDMLMLFTCCGDTKQINTCIHVLVGRERFGGLLGEEGLDSLNLCLSLVRYMCVYGSHGKS